MKLSDVFIARQPILDRDKKTVGYELLFRCSEGTCNVTDNLYATSTVLKNTLNYFKIDDLVGDKKAFINVDEDSIEKIKLF
mgnify:FL=1